ncbi:MAG: TolC family protein [Cyclobacteriaceae bacterium]
MKLMIARFFTHKIYQVIWFKLFLFSCYSLPAQEIENRLGYFDLNQSLEAQLPPLGELIEKAISNHPTIKLNQELIGSAEARVKIARKSWSNLLRGYVDYGYGNQAIIATGSQSGDLSNIANGYRAGANLSIPLSEIFTRNDRINLSKHELAATFFKTREMELVISERVIEEYNNLLLAQRLLTIRFQMQEKARSNVALMEMEYNLGNIDGSVYLRNAEIHTIAQSEYESAKMEFLVAAQKLEVLIGQPLENLLPENDN